MMNVPHQRLRERAGAAGLTALMVGGLGFVLLHGLAAGFLPPAMQQGLATFAVLPDPPPPERVVPPPRKITRPSGKASPPNLRSKATEVTAPVPVIVTVPPPIVVAPLPNIGVQATSGASDRPGPGTGAGGIGNGDGAGGDGDGDGSGMERMPQLIRGDVRGRDVPAWALEQGFHGTVRMRFHIDTQGRPSDCRIVGSSGSAEMDAITCRAVETRFRYRPWRDADGRPVAATVLRDQEWDIPGDDELNARRNGS
ncbi:MULTISPECIES: energy transducer TonB [unclassified Sphingomonas]|jgi:periplasmic protein TonB|uniref:energy transducer TonB n=1 Tax=unclassified Sphingomonas TaxID=196159 RepID=UPI000E1056E3|nr:MULTISPECIES: energy transducer TonB [unclassified Sphingomonas]AXJ96691.1 energy transducer TonB [Sphingomonas sp. FARSPH]